MLSKIIEILISLINFDLISIFGLNFILNFLNLIFLCIFIYFILSIFYSTLCKISSLDKSYQDLENSLSIKTNLLDQKLEKLELLISQLNLSTVTKEESLSSFGFFVSKISKFLELDNNVALHLITNTLITGILLFSTTFLLHQFLRADAREYISSLLNSNAFNTNAITGYVSNEHKTTRESISTIITETQTKISSDVIKSNLDLQEESIKVLLKSQEQQTELLNQLITSQNVIISEQSSDIINVLQDIKSINSSIKNDLDILDVRLSNIADVLYTLSNVDNQLVVQSLLGTIN